MARNFRILEGGASSEKHITSEVTPEKMIRHFRNINSALLQDALNTWGDVWDQLQGSLTHGVMVDPEVEMNFRPKCGWPELMEKMWQLRHYLDHTKRICEGRR